MNIEYDNLSKIVKLIFISIVLYTKYKLDYCVLIPSKYNAIEKIVYKHPFITDDNSSPTLTYTNNEKGSGSFIIYEDSTFITGNNGIDETFLLWKFDITNTDYFENIFWETISELKKAEIKPIKDYNVTHGFYIKYKSGLQIAIIPKFDTSYESYKKYWKSFDRYLGILDSIGFKGNDINNL